MLLSVTDLSKHFGGVRAVDNVTWSIDAAETRCIIGPNGAGKSTFFQLLVGRHVSDAGSIVFQGHDITRAHPFERSRRGIAVKPQTLGVFGELTVKHNLLLPLQRLYGGTNLEDQAAAAMEKLSLSAKRGFLAKELSHGERQWLGIGMAMASEPALLLLDEPTAGMSPAETQRTVNMIKEIGGRGTSVLVVEHDMAFVRELDVPTTVFHQGRLFVSGDISEIERNEEVQRLYLGNHGAARLRSTKETN
ncbi:MAG TPA: ABC transporter ATP-binding protein [Tianweitania sediminis]|jgi:branched-chain amino acid transport system ATP-binding protein|nr:ABC transporter ATP-binding protein [Tianweitania sediminis]